MIGHLRVKRNCPKLSLPQAVVFSKFSKKVSKQCLFIRNFRVHDFFKWSFVLLLLTLQSDWLYSLSILDTLWVSVTSLFKLKSAKLTKRRFLSINSCGNIILVSFGIDLWNLIFEIKLCLLLLLYLNPKSISSKVIKRHFTLMLFPNQAMFKKVYFLHT